MGSLLAFFTLTYAITWALFFGVAAVSNGDYTAFRQLFFLPGTFAPALVAIALTARRGGRDALYDLLQPIFRWKVGAQWFAFAALYMVAIKLTAASIDRLFTGVWPPFGPTPWYSMLAAVIISTPFQAGEEIGWRGYALPRMAARIGYARASVLLGAIWACWHLPLFFIKGTDTYGQPFFVYFLQVTALSVAIAFLYVRTNRSLLLPMLLHAAINNSTGIVPSTGSPLLPWLTAALLWICAEFFLWQLSRRRTKTPAVT